MSTSSTYREWYDFVEARSVGQWLSVGISWTFLEIFTKHIMIIIGRWIMIGKSLKLMQVILQYTMSCLISLLSKERVICYILFLRYAISVKLDVKLEFSMKFNRETALSIIWLVLLSCSRFILGSADPSRFYHDPADLMEFSIRKWNKCYINVKILLPVFNVGLVLFYLILLNTIQ